MTDARNASLLQAALLQAEYACRQLILQAAALADAGDFDSFVQLFSPDAELVRPGGNVLKGREAILASYRQRPAERMTRHLVFPPLFTRLDRDGAEAVSQVLLWSGNKTDAPGPFGRPAKDRQVVGQFVDELKAGLEGWRIVKRTARFELFQELS